MSRYTIRAITNVAASHHPAPKDFKVLIHRGWKRERVLRTSCFKVAPIQVSTSNSSHTEVPRTEFRLKQFRQEPVRNNYDPQKEEQDTLFSLGPK